MLSRAVVHFAVLAFLSTLPSLLADEADDHPLSAAERDALRDRFQKMLKSTPAPAAGDDDRSAIAAHSRRGDALFFSGQYKQAVGEYQAMVKRQPALDESHWRLGIALFFAEQPKQGAEQFDKYRSFDDVDRENGIWRFLCHHRAFGAQKAAKELLKYDKDDREPFPVVYRLFDGSITPEQALKQIPESLPAAERDKRLFYTELYIGLLKTVQKDKSAARKALKNATSRRWPRNAGFGPNYMWHVGRLQYELLLAKP